MNQNTKSELKVLFPGYSNITENGTIKANCSCVLIKGPQNVIVDTRTAWDGQEILEALKENGLSPDDIKFAICTHGHSDHVGCNYLFKEAIHIVGFSVSQGDKYFLSPDFNSGEEYVINCHLKVIPTPGHTLQDVSVIFNLGGEIYAITGDLFENEEDLQNESIWIGAGSDSVDLQRENRKIILKLADYIIPGHGPLFKVPQKYKN